MNTMIKLDWLALGHDWKYCPFNNYCILIAKLSFFFSWGCNTNFDTVSIIVQYAIFFFT